MHNLLKLTYAKPSNSNESPIMVNCGMVLCYGDVNIAYNFSQDIIFD